MIEIVQIPALQDNYIYLLHEPKQKLTAVVDAAVASGVDRELHHRGWKLDFIFNTHHHRDHVGANLELKARHGCKVYGSAKDYARIPGIDIHLRAGEEFFFGSEKIKVFGADGHTLGHIAYWMPESQALFCGDVIFSLGCGKLFEGSPREMWSTLEQLRSLPQDTKVYCAHEYTLENAEFALRVESGNPALLEKVERARELRAENKPTIPTLLREELAANPFLRPESAEIQKNVSAVGRELWEIFGATRSAKDEFDSREV